MIMIPEEEDLNELYPDVELNLEILMEECSEVIQIKSKIYRFGMLSCNPSNGLTNKELLIGEIGDVLAMVDILKSNGLISQEDLDRAKDRKILKLRHSYKVDKLN